MRRLLAIAATAALLLAVGCSKDYETRLTVTVDNMRYQKRLDDNLMPAEKGKFEELFIYIRPPKNMAPSKEFLLPVLEPGEFDLEQSFLDSTKNSSLHVMARVKRPPANKKAAPPPPRKDFNSDVLATLNAAYKPSPELDLSRFKPVEKKKSNSRFSNEFRLHTFASNEKTIQAYLYKKDPYDVALVFEFPTKEQPSLTSKIDLCLQAFAVGERAKAAFSGTAGEEETAAGASSGGAAF